MFLLTTHNTRWKGTPQHRLYHSREDAVAKAVEFVGYHNPVDSCSSPPQVVDRPNHHWAASRPSSFGTYTASVEEIHSEDTPTVNPQLLKAVQDLEYCSHVLDEQRFSGTDQNPKGIRDMLFSALREAARLSGVTLDAVKPWHPPLKSMTPEQQRKVESLNENSPGWRLLVHPNGARMFSSTGTMLDDQGGRSIFDDVDE